ncbi:MAG: hypothetical protein C5B50_24640 [Verrucomicrobia bacterium]|nr:MAG: hypothetical protein C5B50_24640 [Verrucomicrobiota bacterium]
MSLVTQKASGWFTTPVLTRKRVFVAFAVALVTDALQLAFGALLGPLGWFINDGLDVIAMGITCAALGFHPLLLPTFIIKLVPLADMLPTWTGCTAAVVMLRKRAQTEPPVIVPMKSITAVSTPSAEPPREI